MFPRQDPTILKYHLEKHMAVEFALYFQNRAACVWSLAEAVLFGDIWSWILSRNVAQKTRSVAKQADWTETVNSDRTESDRAKDSLSIQGIESWGL
jgi:hypothetical protein